MDPTTSYRTQAESATQDLSSLQNGAPGMLAELKKNLVGIFAKDNPIIQARGTALQDYLNTPSASRASTLPGNLPMVEGSNLNLSPTQQDAITTARSNAALVPLVGLNQIITGQYGNIGDIVQGAASNYQSSIDAAKTRAASLIDLYKTAVAEQEAKTKAAGSGGLDLAGIIAAIRAAMGNNAGDGRVDISQFDEPDQPDNVVTPGGVIIPSVPKTNTAISQPLNLNGYDFGGISLNQPSTVYGTPITSHPGRDLFAGLNLQLGGNQYGL